MFAEIYQKIETMENHKTFTILIADDDPDDLDYMKFLFQNHQSFEIAGCLKTGVEIVETIIDHNKIPDILLTDMYMPIMTGAEVVAELSEKSAAPAMEIFIISTVINRIEEEKLQNRHVKFLLKPTSLAEINDLPELILDHLHAKNINRI
jgi:CheY-like chemotaxis protein